MLACFLFSTTPPPPPHFFLPLLPALSKFSPGYARLNFSSGGVHQLAFFIKLLSKGSLPEDIIKSNEGASLTIC